MHKTAGNSEPDVKQSVPGRIIDAGIWFKGLINNNIPVKVYFIAR